MVLAASATDSHDGHGSCLSLIRTWLVGWLVGYFELNGPLRQYFSLYRLRERWRKKKEMIDERKNVQTTPTHTYCKRSRPLPYYNPN